MDFSNSSISDLCKLQERVTQELKMRKKQELAGAREQILAIANTVGMSVKDLLSSGIRAKAGTVAVQFRNPDDASQQWTGRGRQPNWIKEWIESGKSLDQLRV